MNIYAEGFAATGQAGQAQRIGTAPGATLREAADNLAKMDPDFAHYYNPKTLTYWGCKLFDNLADAQRSFG